MDEQINPVRDKKSKTSVISNGINPVRNKKSKTSVISNGINPVRNKKPETSVISNGINPAKTRAKSFAAKKLSFYIVAGLAFLLPIFFIPSALFPIFLSKNLLLTVAVFVLFTLWVLERIKNKDFIISKSPLLILAGLVPLSYLLSAFFSGSIKNALLGANFEIGVFATIFVLFLFIFLTANSLKSKKEIPYIYAGLLFSFGIMALFQIARLFFGPEFLALGIFGKTNSNFIGAWNELGVFSGLIALLALSASEFMGQNKTIKISSYIVLGTALFLVALVNFSAVWIMLGVFSLTLTLYSFWLAKNKRETRDNKTHLPILSLIVFLVALVFIFAKAPVGNFLPSLFNIQNFEVRPTIGATIDIAQATLTQNPLLGVGPNNFASQWVLHKPVGVNNTMFWNVDFNSGSNFILTSLVTVGILGFLSWFLFLAALIFYGLKLMKISRQNKFEHYLILSPCLATLYLWMFAVIYVPGTVILGLSCLFTGILFALFYQAGIVKTKTIFLRENGRIKIILITVITFISLAFISGGYFIAKNTTALIQSQRSLRAVNAEGDLGKAVELMSKAAENSKNDAYYRLLTDMNLAQLQFVLNRQDVPAETLQQQFQAVLGNAVGNAQTAVRIGGKNYQNWTSLGRVYGAIVPLKVAGAYDSALNSYVEAINLNPSNPALVLALANLELANEDIEKAREYIGRSIQMKNNYSDAYYLLSQIELSAGNNEQAVKVIEALANMTPNDSRVFLQLGALEYNFRNYEKAIISLEKAVLLNPYFTDAKYLLGLSYDNTGEKGKAIGQFEDLNILNPNNENITTILDNLKKGQKALFGLEQQTTPQINDGVFELTEDETGKENEEE